MTSHLEHALAYARMGYPVFPLAKLSKVPLEGSSGFKDATTDHMIITRWWTENPHANIGIYTDGLVVFDKDPEGDQWLQDNIDLLLEAPRQRTPRGGYHFIFRQNGVRFSSRAGRVARGVDTRADGGYIVVEPSYVVDAKCDGGYRWDENFRLRPRDELPEVSGELLKQLQQAEARKTPVPNENQKIPRSGRHDYLLERAIELKNALVPRDVARKILAELNQTMCDPPINVDRDFKSEVERMLDFADRIGAVGLPAGACPEIDRFRENSALSGLRYESLVERDEYLQARAKVKEIVAQEQMPAEVFDQLPDVAQAAFEYYRDGFAYRVQPELWLGSFIALTATMISHRVFLPDGTRSNIYCVGSGGTGRGKDATRQWGKRLCNLFGMAGMVDSGRITSMSGILTSLSGQNPICLCPDEFGMVISQAIDPGKDARYAETIVQALLELYSSSADPYYQLTNYADVKKRHQPIAHPCMSMWAVSTPKTLWHRMTTGAIEAGLVPRFLFFSECQDPEERAPNASVQPAEVLSNWVRRWKDPSAGKDLIAQAHEPAEPATVTSEARDLMQGFRRQCDSLIDDDEPQTLVWSRATQNASKLALIFSSWLTTEESSKVVVGAQAAKWGITVAEHSIGLVLRQMERFMVDNEADRVCQRFLELIRRHADAEGWCKRRDIHMGMGTTKFNYAKQALLRSGQIESETRPTKTRPSEFFRETDDQ